MRVSLFIGCAVAALTLNACSKFDALRPDIAAKPNPSRLDEIAYINILRSAFINYDKGQKKWNIDGTTYAAPTQIAAKTNAKDDKLKSKKTKKPEQGDDNKETNQPESIDLKDLQNQIVTQSGLCFDGSGLEYFQSKLGQGLHNSDGREEMIGEGRKSRDECITYKAYQRPNFNNVTQLNDKQSQLRLLEMQTYLAAGFGLTDIYCNRFFTTASASGQNRQFFQDVNTGVDALVGSVLSLSGVGTTAIGITNSGFGLIGDGLEAYDAAYLVAPDLGSVQKLLEAAQAKFRAPYFAGDNATKANIFPRSYPAARAVIERYASLCSFTGMRQLINRSINDETSDIEKELLRFTRPTRATNQKPETPLAADAADAADGAGDNPATNASEGNNAANNSSDSDDKMILLPPIG